MVKMCITWRCTDLPKPSQGRVLERKKRRRRRRGWMVKALATT